MIPAMRVLCVFRQTGEDASRALANSCVTFQAMLVMVYLFQGVLHKEIANTYPRIAWVSRKTQIGLLAEPWCGASSIGFGSRRRRIRRCFCVYSVHGGRLRARINILEPGRDKKVVASKTRIWQCPIK